VGDPGGNLRRFARKELLAVTREDLDFRLAVLQNLAAVCLRQEKFDQAVHWADQALCIQGRAPKALMRKGSALLRLNQPGPASDVLATAAEEVPNDAEVRRLLREAEKTRSPMWVCATGCCGPWGIVCGGAVAQAMPEVVAPASRKPLDEAGAVQDKPDKAIDAGVLLAPKDKQRAAEAEEDMPASQSGSPSELQEPRSEPAERKTAVLETQESPASDRTAKASEAARHASMEKSAAGLLWVAVGSLLVAAVSAAWMFYFPSVLQV